MNSYIIFIPWYSYKAEADQLADGLDPDPDSLFGQVRSCFTHLVFAGALNANNADCGFDQNGLFIYIESADVFDDARGQDELHPWKPRESTRSRHVRNHQHSILFRYTV